MIIAIPKEKEHFIEASLLERNRNYKEIYYCDLDFTGNHAFKELLKELRRHPEEVPQDIPSGIRKFLTMEKAKLTTQEYMQLTMTPLNNAIELIKQTTKNEKIKYLCDYRENAKNDYKVLYNGKSEGYIRRILKKVLPNFQEDSNCIFKEDRTIKPYKRTKFGSTNIITEIGIQKFEDRPHSISLEPIKVSILAFNPELLRLELGMKKEEFERKYGDTIREIIRNQQRPLQELELKYVLQNEKISIEDLLKVLTNEHEMCDKANYVSHDEYYDTPKFSLLENGKALRIRHGVTYHDGVMTREYKRKRITYKTYEEDKKTTYTHRTRQEELGNSLELKDYLEFLEENELPKDLTKVLELNGFRKLYTIKVGKQLIDISFTVDDYQNHINNVQGNIKSIEIKPRDNQIMGRVLLLDIKKQLEEAFPQLKDLISNANVYETAMIDSYEKGKKDEETKPTEIFVKIRGIIENLRNKRILAKVNGKNEMEKTYNVQEK